MKNKKTRNLICSLLLAAVLVGVLLYIDNSPLKSSMLSTVLQKGAIYALLVVSMNLAERLYRAVQPGPGRLYAAGRLYLCYPYHSGGSAY